MWLAIKHRYLLLDEEEEEVDEEEDGEEGEEDEVEEDDGSDWSEKISKPKTGRTKRKPVTKKTPARLVLMWRALCVFLGSRVWERRECYRAHHLLGLHGLLAVLISTTTFSNCVEQL